MSTDNTIDYNEEAAKFIEKYLSIPEDLETTPDNLSFDQLLGKALYEKLNEKASMGLDRLFDKEKINDYDLHNKHVDEDADPLLADQYKNENKFDGIIRLFKEHGQKFTEDDFINAGLGSRKQETKFRNIDENDEYIDPIEEGELQPMLKEGDIIDSLGAGVFYHKRPEEEVNDIAYKNPEEDFLLIYDIDSKEITLMFDTDLQLQEFLYHAGDTNILGSTYVTSQDEKFAHAAISIDKTDSNLRPLLQLLQKNDFISHAASAIFDKSVTEHSQDLGIK